MRPLLLAFWLLPMTVRICEAYPLAKVVLRGNLQVSSEEIIDYLHSLSENPYRNIESHSELLLAEQRIQDAIVTYYTQRGFLRASIDSVQTGLLVPPDSAQGYSIKLSVTEARQYHLRNIRGASLPGIYTGDLFRETRLHGAIGELLKDCETRGYPLAKINIESIQLSDDTD